MIKKLMLIIFFGLPILGMGNKEPVSGSLKPVEGKMSREERLSDLSGWGSYEDCSTFAGVLEDLGEQASTPCGAASLICRCGMIMCSELCEKACSKSHDSAAAPKLDSQKSAIKAKKAE